MGGGNPLSFLNKKPWHPSRPQNLEKVWKREQQADAEKKRVDELRAQYEEERKNQEFLDIAHQAGHGKASDRLDWMYAGSLASKEDAAKKQDEALLGQRPAQLPDTAEPGAKVDTTSQLQAAAAAAAAPTPASYNEQWNRLNNDPLLMIKKQQQEQLKSLRDNPVKFQELLKLVQGARSGGKPAEDGSSAKKERKRAKKERKRAKKELKRAKKGRKVEADGGPGRSSRRSSDSGSSSSSSDDSSGGQEEQRGFSSRGAGPPAGLSMRGMKGGPVGAAALPLPPTFGQKPEPAAGPSGRRHQPGHEPFRRSRDDDLNEGMSGRGATYEREERDLVRGFRGQPGAQDTRNGGRYEREGERYERGSQRNEREGRGQYEREGERYKRDGRHEKGGERYDRHGGRFDKDADRERLRDGRDDDRVWDGKRLEGRGRDRDAERDIDRVQDERRLEARGRDREGERDARSSGRGAEREREAEPSASRRGEREERGIGREGRGSRKEERVGDRRGSKQEGERNGEDGAVEPFASAGAARRHRGDDDEDERRGADRYGYGLSQNINAPAELLKRKDNSTRASETRAHLEGAAKRRAEEEAAKAAQRHVPRDYKAGKVSEEERARRLAEMSSNAEQHDMARSDRLQRAAAADTARDGVVANTGGMNGTVREGDAFMKAASRDVYGALSGASISDRVNSRKHYVSRG